jgi:AraC family transcriptional regulator
MKTRSTATLSSIATPVAIPFERSWRVLPCIADGPADVMVSIWRDMREEPRTLVASTPDAWHLIAVSIRAATLSLEVDGRAAMSGRIRPGMVQITSPGQRSRLDCTGPCEMLHIHVSRDRLQRCWEDAEVPHAVKLSRPPYDMGYRDGDIERLCAMILRADVAQPGYERAYVESLVCGIVFRMLDCQLIGTSLSQTASQGTITPALKQAVAFVDENLTRPISARDVIAAIGIGSAAFHRAFRMTYGVALPRYLTAKRVELSKNLMTSTDHRLVDIALSSGFRSQSHFSSEFKRLVGETPNLWRKHQAVLGALPAIGG